MIEFRNDDGGIDYCGRHNRFIRCIADTCKYGIEFYYYSGSEDSKVDSNQFYNCIFYETDYLFWTKLENSDNDFTNCIVMGVTDEEGVGARYTNNVEMTYSDFYDNGFSMPSGTGNISDNPNMSVPENDDFTLQEGSPCIDAGTDVGLDYEGEAPDMGAFEFEEEEEEEPFTTVSKIRTSGRGKIMRSRGKISKTGTR
jgi:hypothetical protein